MSIPTRKIYSVSAAAIDTETVGTCSRAMLIGSRSNGKNRIEGKWRG